MKAVTYTRTAIKALKTMPAKDSKALMAKIDNYAAGATEDVQALQGSDLFRHRNWRAIFSQTDTVLAVLNVAKRGAAYR